MKRLLRGIAMLVLGILVIVLAIIAIDVLRRRASHDRNWTREQARMPVVRVVGDDVTIRNIRDFRHHESGAPEERWIEASYDIAQVERVWFVLSPFVPRFAGIAHPFLSFEFADGRTLAVSVEARKEVGEVYSPLSGMLRRYETMMVIGTEDDLLALRVIAWDDPLYLFPVRVTPAQAQYLFRSLLARAQELEQTPTWYNTVTNNCTTAMVRAINALADDDADLGPLVGLLPGYSLEAAFERGWIDTELSLEETRRAHHANERIRAAIGRSDFSRAIRTGG